MPAARSMTLVLGILIASSVTLGCSKMKSMMTKGDAGSAGDGSTTASPAVTASASAAVVASAAPSASAAASPVDRLAGKWSCRFENNIGSSITETITFTASPDGSAKASATGRGSVGAAYSGQATATFKDGTWSMTFRWSNNASPTWVRVKVAESGLSLSGRRGKFDDARYEGNYNCKKA